MIKKYWFWFLIVWLLMISHSTGVLLLIISLLIFIFSKKLLKPFSHKKQNYRYKYENFDKGLQQIADNCPAIQDDEVEISNNVEDARIANDERNERLETYDFREFIGRHDVTWEEVEDYLWLHCKYKGYQMWTEYCMYLVSQGIILKTDIQKIFDKHRKYISITPRPDLEAKEEKKREEQRWFWNKQERIEKHYEDLAVNEHYNYKHSDGTIHNIYADLGCGKGYKFKRDTSDSSLKELFYDEYLKRKGLMSITHDLKTDGLATTQ